jgi:O-antigen/teichoic acid export membrane protein
MLTRTLGPDAYGQYSFIFVTVAMCSALFDFGMENTAVRFAAKDKDQTHAIFGLYLTVKLGTLLALVLFFAFGGEWLFGLMHKSAVNQYIPYLIAGLIGESLFFVNDTYLQARQQFQARAALNIARFFTAMLYIAALTLGHWMKLELVFLVYLVPVGFTLLFLPKYLSFIGGFLRADLENPLFRQMMDYERWMFIYSTANNLLGRIDFFMLGYWVHFQQLGIYNAAFQLCSIVSFLPLCLGKVLLPALSELSDQEIFQKSRKLIKGTWLVCLVAAAIIPLTGWFVPIILGKDYASAVTILQILLLAFIMGLLSMPYEQSIYSLGRPKMLSLGRYIQLGLIVSLNLFFLPTAGETHGAYVAATTGLIGRVIYLLYARYFYLKYEKETGLLFSQKLVTESI